MLGSLRGAVTGTLGQRTLIEVDSVGYWVYTGSWQPSGETLCYLHHHVREDINDLYGFETIDGLALFERLLEVNGIGPKAALAVLSLGDANRLATAIAQGDIRFLTLAPGIGKKAAEKIILELKGKLHVSGESLSGTATVPDDLVSALEGLGYRPTDIQGILAELPKELATLEEQIKWVLKRV